MHVRMCMRVGEGAWRVCRLRSSACVYVLYRCEIFTQFKLFIHSELVLPTRGNLCQHLQPNPRFQRQMESAQLPPPTTALGLPSTAPPNIIQKT